MADFSSLKQTIQSYIKQNGNEEITGNILQDVLLAMVTTMGDSAINGLVSALQNEITARQNQDGTLQGNITAETTARQQADTALGGRIDGLQTAINGINTKMSEGYIYAGIATPSTNPGTPSGKVFYIAVQAGTYTNFGGTEVSYGINILKYNGSAWSKNVIFVIDDEPTAGSDNPVKSGGVFANDSRLAQIYDGMIDFLEYPSVDGSPVGLNIGETSPNGINHRNGSTYTSASYAHTDYIDISAYEAIIYGRAQSTSRNTVLGIAFYDSSKVYISGQQAFITTTLADRYTRTLIRKPVFAKYVRLSVNVDTENWGNQYLYGCMISESLKIENDIHVLELNQDDICYDFSISADGSLYPKDGHTPNMGCTSYIPCEGANSILYRQVISRDKVAASKGLAFYDANKVFISFVPGIHNQESSGSRLNEVAVPENAKYFRTTYFNRFKKDEFGGDFYARIESKDIAYKGKRANNNDLIFFTVPVNQSVDKFWSSDVDEPQLESNMLDTTGVLLLPSTYTPDGEPTKLIINFHGYSHSIIYGQWGNPEPGHEGFMQQKYRWAAAGYAVMDCNNWRYTLGTGQSGLGSRQSMEAYRKCFEWVKEHYNIDARPYIVCGSAGGPTGINCCYAWGDVRAAVWLDCWTTLAPDQNSYTSCKDYYPELFGFNDKDIWEADKVVSYNPTGRIFSIGSTSIAEAPLCPVKVIWRGESFANGFYDALKNGGGRLSIRRVTSISHDEIVSGYNGIIDTEIINWLGGF